MSFYRIFHPQNFCKNILKKLFKKYIFTLFLNYNSGLATGPTSVSQLAKTYVYQLCVDNGLRLEDLRRGE